MNKTARMLLVGCLAVVASVLLAGGGFAAGYLTHQVTDTLALRGAAPTPNGAPADLQATFQPFWEAWDLVHQQYVDQPVDDVKLMQGAIRGMVGALGDPHSSYMTPDEYQVMFNTSLSGQLEGIGAEVVGADGYLQIVSPYPGSPAEKAGILPGDMIVAVDGQEFTGLTEVEMISHVRGPAGTVAHITIVRTGVADPMQFDVTRAKITIPSVESKMLDNNLGYVKINDFGEKTSTELEAALKTLLAQNPKGLVLDLRGNPGGYVNTAIQVASEFISNGVVMRVRYSDGSEKSYDANAGGVATQIPLVVLVNKGSASASEIVAGAIQDYARGKIVGEVSYGKGSEQLINPLQNNGGVVRITNAHWLTPKSRSIDKKGITPDVPVARSADDIKANRDPQLDAAVKLLLGQ